MDTKILALAALSLLLSTNALAGVNKFTISKFETPNGSTTKVLSNTNKNALKLVVACNNKLIGDDMIKGKILVVGQDYDVVTSVKSLGNNRIRVITENGWSEVFQAQTIPRC